MAVHSLRTHYRYAVRAATKLTAKGRKPQSCLVIELSSDGARLSNLSECCLEEGDDVTLEMPGSKGLQAIVRWAHDGVAGLRFASPLSTTSLSKMVDACRSADYAPESKVA